jgi:hypothetical protein
MTNLSFAVDPEASRIQKHEIPIEFVCFDEMAR